MPQGIGGKPDVITPLCIHSMGSDEYQGNNTKIAIAATTVISIHI